MKKQTPLSHYFFLGRLVVAFLFLFLCGKLFFLLYNQDIMPFTLGDACQVWLHGFTMDLSTVGYLMVLPWLMSFVGMWCPGFKLRRWLLPYYVIVALVLSLIICGDAYLYDFWKFKLNAAIFAYMQSISGTTNSVSTLFLLSRVAVMLLVMAGVFGGLWILTPHRLRPVQKRVLHSFLMLLLAGVQFLCIRGSIGTSTMNVGVAYYSPHLFLNHAAVNPAFSLISSVSKTENFSRQFDYFSEEERARQFEHLYPDSTPHLTDTLLRVQRPHLLVVLMESYGSKFIRELGGLPEVSPHYSRLIPEGIFWKNYYSNSFRTDRGTLSALSGWISYPTASLMKMPGKLNGIPSIARSLQREGYRTDFLYGGDVEIMGMKGYLVGSGYQGITSDKDFSLVEAKESKWGANDAVTANRVLADIRRKPVDKPWHMTYLTLSSHEPFEVPYNRLSDVKLNAFAFTDECIGHLVDSLKTLPIWDNLLVVLLPDHGYLYDMTYEEPEFFHCPMLWLGGAIRRPRQMEVLMNQSDVAATLLAQMGISHTDFPWSRNVLSPAYTYPFAYSTFPGGILFADSTGVSVYDIAGKKSIREIPTSSPIRIQRAQAILQSSYDLLDAMNAPTTP